MRPRRRVRIPPIRPRADPRLSEVLASIGVPAQTPFRPDAFQLEALAAVESADCLVTAPTGAGKTWIAERAMARALEKGQRSWYASPLKALSNSKYAEFRALFHPENVGILTGDRKENPDAPIVVGTQLLLTRAAIDLAGSRPRCLESSVFDISMVSHCPLRLTFDSLVDVPGKSAQHGIVASTHTVVHVLYHRVQRFSRRARGPPEQIDSQYPRQ